MRGAQQKGFLCVDSAPFSKIALLTLPITDLLLFCIQLLCRILLLSEQASCARCVRMPVLLFVVRLSVGKVCLPVRHSSVNKKLFLQLVYVVWRFAM